MKTANAVVTPKRTRTTHITSISGKYPPYTPLSTFYIEDQTRSWAELIESKFEALTEILLEYESYEVVKDETERTLDLLQNIKDNNEYFRLRVNEVAAFLPRNQPLYAFTCFVVIPSLMASKVHFRIPHGMRHFFPKMLALLEVHTRFPNITVSHDTRLEFLRKRSALRINPKTEETLPGTDVVIFTGTSAHADQLRLIFDHRTLFISNGSGHNPFVVSKNADVQKAVDAIISLQFYNQGQDCAAPNATLVHADVYSDFLRLLREQIRTIHVGEYADKLCRVGPNSDPKDLVRVQDFLVHHKAWIDQSTQGIIRTHDAIIEPTIICKPLTEGGNFAEIFAPIIFVQKYENDSELALYFENPHYAQNAMYISLYGASAYIESLVDRLFNGKVLHDKASVLHNANPHDVGIERGTQPYGGCGRNSSSVSINGKLICKPTLPQRDIFEEIVEPLMHGQSLQARIQKLLECTRVQEKGVEKLLQLTSRGTEEHREASAADVTYVDMHSLKKVKGTRYVTVDEKHTHHLLAQPNVEHITELSHAALESIRALSKLVRRRSKMSPEKLTTLLYALVVKPGATEHQNQTRQRAFFENVYQLLLGKHTGPRLSQFLLDIDKTKVLRLLDV